MSTINGLNAKLIAKLFGSQVCVDFINESKCPPLIGILYAWDPESNSIVLVEQLDLEGSENNTKILLIPGTSIQNMRFLKLTTIDNKTQTTEGDQPEQSTSASQPDDAKNSPVMMTFKDGKELCNKLRDTIFNQCVVPDNSNYKETELKEMPKIADGQQSTTIDSGTSRKRTIAEPIKIFNDYLQTRRQAIIDALNKNNICYREEPYFPLLTKRTAATNKQSAQKTKRTVIVVNGQVKISPPYKKVNIDGPKTVVSRLLLVFKAEGVCLE